MSFDGESNTSDQVSTILDPIKPLQHVSGLSTLYRKLAGGLIEVPAKILREAIFQGVFGAAFAVENEVVKNIRGKYVEDEVGELINKEIKNHQVKSKPKQKKLGISDTKPHGSRTGSQEAGGAQEVSRSFSNSERL